MKLISLDTDSMDATIEFRGKQKTLKFRYASGADHITVPIAGTVGRTGTKLWIGYQTFFLRNGEWSKGGAYGGINLRSFTPVCFVDEIDEMPEGRKCKR